VTPDILSVLHYLSVSEEPISSARLALQAFNRTDRVGLIKAGNLVCQLKRMGYAEEVSRAGTGHTTQPRTYQATEAGRRIVQGMGGTL
jgi:hypothetical protein